jgi:hypothetical protein
MTTITLSASASSEFQISSMTAGTGWSRCASRRIRSSLASMGAVSCMQSAASVRQSRGCSKAACRRGQRQVATATHTSGSPGAPDTEWPIQQRSICAKLPGRRLADDHSDSAGRGGRSPSAVGRSVTASLMPAVLGISVIRRAGGRPGVVVEESTAAGHRSRPADLPLEGVRSAGWSQGCTPGSAVHLQAEKRGQRGPSVAVRETADGVHRPPHLCTPTVVTVHTDRPMPHGRPSAIWPLVVARGDRGRADDGRS